MVLFAKVPKARGKLGEKCWKWLAKMGKTWLGTIGNHSYLVLPTVSDGDFEHF